MNIPRFKKEDSNTTLQERKMTYIAQEWLNFIFFVNIYCIDMSDFFMELKFLICKYNE